MMDEYDDMYEEDDELTIAEVKRVKHNAFMKSYMKKRNLEHKWLKSHVLFLAEELQDSGMLGSLSDRSRKFLTDAMGLWPRKLPALLLKLFNGDPAVGKSVTARHAMETIYKGKSEMKVMITRWAKHGVVLGYELDPEGGPLEARYVIRELPKDTIGGLEIDPKDFKDLA